MPWFMLVYKYLERWLAEKPNAGGVPALVKDRKLRKEFFEILKQGAVPFLLVLPRFLDSIIVRTYAIS